MMAFYESGTVKLPDGGELTVKQPVLLMLRANKLYAADPAQSLKAIDISLNGRGIKINFAEGQFAGSTVSVD